MTTETKVGSMIETTIISVLSRPRFNIKVEPVVVGGYGGVPYYPISCSGFTYHVKFFKNLRGTSISVTATNDWPKWQTFFNQHVNHKRISNIRKIGITMANKIKMRPIHHVMNL